MTYPIVMPRYHKNHDGSETSFARLFWRNSDAIGVHENPLRLVSLVLTSVVGLALLGLWMVPREPTHQGRALSIWMEDLRGIDEETRNRATAAIQEMGTNALPYYLEIYRSRDSRLKLKIMRLMMRQPYLDLSLTTAPEMKSRATRAIAIIGTNAIPILTHALHESHPDIRLYCAINLGKMESDASAALPVLFECLTWSS